MIKFEHTEIVGWEAAIRGMYNPINSWEKSDTENSWFDGDTSDKDHIRWDDELGTMQKIGPNDLALMKKLREAGTDHRKFMRMITVYLDITAPLYWWKEFDTYKVDTVANSCSTMHKIHDKEFTLEDFSCEHLDPTDSDLRCCIKGTDAHTALDIMHQTIMTLNLYRYRYLETKDKKFWSQMIQLLPSSYNQKRTVMISYEVLANIYKSRNKHKQDEWCEHEDSSTIRAVTMEELTEIRKRDGLCDWIHTLPYSELIVDSESLKTVKVGEAISKGFEAGVFDKLVNMNIVSAKDFSQFMNPPVEEEAKNEQLI